MPYAPYEESDQDGRFVSLYEFRQGTTFFRYTSADKAIDIDLGSGTVTFNPVAINDGGTQQGGGDGNNDQLAVTIQSDTDLAVLFDGVAPSDKVWLTKRKLQLDDADQDAVVAWVGSIASVQWKDASSKIVNCITLLASMASSGLRLCWERNCGHMLYGPGCKLNADDFAFTNSAQPVSGDQITINIPSPLPAAPLLGGFVKFTNDKGAVERRVIIDINTLFVPFENASATLLGGTEGMVSGSTIEVYPGCDRTTGPSGCSGFSNTDNFGGFPQQPGKSPFDGDPVF